jgi:anti-anti-sigma factor
MALAKVEVSKSVDSEGITVVRVKGAIVTNLSGTDAAPVMEEVMKSGGQPKVILNLASVRYLDSYSFNWIIKLMREIQKAGGAFAISDPNEQVQALFELSSFGKAVPVYRTEHDAREAIVSGDESRRIGNN